MNLRKAEEQDLLVRVRSKYNSPKDRYYLKDYGLTNFDRETQSWYAKRISPHSDFIANLQQRITEYNSRLQRKTKISLKIEIER